MQLPKYLPNIALKVCIRKVERKKSRLSEGVKTEKMNEKSVIKRRKEIKRDVLSEE